MLSSGVSRFSFDFFGLTVLKNFVGNDFNLPEIFGYRNFPCLRTENHVLQSKNFVSQFAKKSWEPLLSFRKLGISGTFIRITVFLDFFLSQSTEKLREEPSNVSKSFKCEVTKKIFNENGISRFSVENFLAQSAIERSEIFRYRIFLCMRTENHVVHSKFFVSQYAKNSWERLLRFKMFGIRKLFGTLRYIKKVRLSKNFMPKRVISIFSVEFFSRILKTFMFSRGNRDSPLIFLASQY